MVHMSNKSDSVWTLSFRMAVALVISKVIKWFFIGTLIVVGIFFIVDYTTSDITDKYAEATKLLSISIRTSSKQKFKQDYLEVTDKIADIYKSTQTKENNSNSDTIGSILDSGVLELGNNWYENVSNLSQGSMVVDLGDGIGLYDGLPWVPAEGCYFFNTDKSTEDFYNLLKNTMENENEVALPSDTYDLFYMLGEKSDDREAYEYTYTAIANASTVASDGSITWTGSLSKNLTSGIGWKLGKKWLYKEIDEIKCAGVCALPAAYDKSYCLAWSSEGQWYNKSNSQVVNYNNSKAAIVYKKIGDVEDKFYYLPVTYGDAKAHTFPGGVVQTNVKVASDSTFDELKVIVDGKDGEQSWNLSSFGYSMHTESSNGKVLMAYTRTVVESIGWSLEFTKNNTATNGYRVIGWVIWP